MEFNTTTMRTEAARPHLGGSQKHRSANSAEGNGDFFSMVLAGLRNGTPGTEQNTDAATSDQLDFVDQLWMGASPDEEEENHLAAFMAADQAAVMFGTVPVVLSPSEMDSDSGPVHGVDTMQSARNGSNAIMEAFSNGTMRLQDAEAATGSASDVQQTDTGLFSELSQWNPSISDSVQSNTNADNTQRMESLTDLLHSGRDQRSAVSPFGDQGRRSEVIGMDLSAEASSAKAALAEGVDGKSAFQSALYQARKLFLDENRMKDPTEPDSQHEVLTELPLTGADPAMSKDIELASGTESEIPVKEADVMSQVTTGIVDHLKTKDQEFTIQLKPEGLGEITVEMKQNDGKIMISILTSSAQTEKLLTGELDALRDSLRMMNVEIEKVTYAGTTTDTELFGSGQQYQSFSEGRHFQWGREEQLLRSFKPDIAGPTSVMEQITSHREPRLADSLLNRYI